METTRLMKCAVCRTRFWEISVSWCPNCETDIHDGFEVVNTVPDFQLSLELLQRKYGDSEAESLYQNFLLSRDESEKEYSDLDALPFEELPVFEIATGTIAVGDPNMGLVEYDVSQLAPGLYRPRPGAFRLATADEAATRNLPLIPCDGVYVVVVDASKQNELAADFETESDVAMWASRLGELSKQLGVRAALYWSGDLVGEHVEGNYLLDVSMLSRAD